MTVTGLLTESHLVDERWENIEKVRSSGYVERVMTINIMDKIAPTVLSGKKVVIKSSRTERSDRYWDFPRVIKEIHVLIYLREWEEAEVGDICEMRMNEDNGIVYRKHTTNKDAPLMRFESVKYTFDGVLISLWRRTE